MTGTWDVVVPASGTNYVTNPSFEGQVATGWSATNTTISFSVGGKLGAIGLTGTATNATNFLISATLVTTSTTADWTASVWMYATQTCRLVLQNAGTSAALASADHPGDGTWRRLECSASVGSGVGLRVYVTNLLSSAWAFYFVDGFQLEQASAATTYIDGDQDGCVWTGAPHASASTRDGRDGRGGTIQTLGTANLSVRTFAGTGMPDTSIASTPLAVRDGSVYQQSLVPERVFSLSVLASGTSLADLHAQRSALFGHLNPDKRANRGPIRLRYTGAAANRVIDAYYEGGMAFEKPLSPQYELTPIRFRAPDPFWYAEMDSSASLTATQSLSTVRNFMWRNRSGAWSNMDGGQQSSFTGYPQGFDLGPDGYLYAWGSFTGNLSGSARAYLARWDGSAWSAPSSTGQPNDAVFAFEQDMVNGGVYVGGQFTQIGAVAHSRVARIAAGAGAAVAMSTGANNTVNGLVFDASGRLIVTGAFTSIGGTGVTRSASWNGSAFAAYGTAAEALQQIQIGPDGLLYGMGISTIYRGSSGWTSFATVSGGAGTLWSIQWRPDGLYAFGSFTSIGGVSANCAARYRGGAWEALATSTTSSFAASVIVGRFGPDGVFHGMTTCSLIDGISFPATSTQWAAVRWDGSVWTMEDFLPPDNATQVSVWPQTDGTLALGMSLAGAGTATVPGLTTVTNDGSAEAFPVVSITGGSGNVYSLVNLTTGKQLRFNGLTKYGAETIVLDFRPGRKTVSSTYRQLIGTVIAGSDLDAWALAPGTNTIQLFCGSGVTSATIHWRQRDWGLD